MKKLIFSLLSLALVACGNAERGAVIVKGSTSSNGIGLVTHVTNASDDPRFNLCHYFDTFYNPNTPASAFTATELYKIAICPSTTNADYIKIKAGPNLPDSTRICVIPVNNTVMGTEVCLAVANEEIAQVQTKGANRFYLVEEQHLSALKSFVALDVQNTGNVFTYPANAPLFYNGAIGRTRPDFAFASSAH